MHRLARGCAAVAALLAALSAGAAAQESDEPGPAATVGVTAFTPWNDPERPMLSIALRVHNTGAVPLEDARVRLVLHDRVLSRSALRSALDGRPSEPIAGTTVRVADPLPPNGDAEVKIERDLALLDSSFGRRGTGGVYPVEIELRGSNRSLWKGWAAVVYFPSAPAARLNVAWALPVHAPAMYDPPAQTYPGPAIDAAFGPDGSVAAAVKAAAAAAKRLPVTLAPSGLLLDTLADVADGFERRDGSRVVTAVPEDAAPRGAAESLAALRDAVAVGSPAELASTPYARADLVSLSHAELDATRQLQAGADRVRTHLERPPRTEVLMPSGLRLDSKSAAAAAAFGARVVVLDPALLPPQPGIFGPDRPVRVTGRGGVQLDVLLADEPIRGRLDRAAPARPDRADPMLAAQGALAESASAWFERPALAGARSLVLATTTTPDARTIAALAAGLAEAPWIQMRTAGELATAVDAEEDPIPMPLGRVEPGDRLKALKAARRAVDVLGRVVVDPPDATALLDRRVLAAESADFDEGSRGTAIALAAKAEADRTVGSIESPSRHITLTSRTGQLPVTVLNGTRFRVRVLVRLESAKVAFPDGAEETFEIDANRQETITFPAKALATGSFGVGVELRTPDGAIPIGTESIVVRSTAVSAVALITIGGGVVVLVAAWLRRGRRTPKPVRAGAASAG